MKEILYLFHHIHHLHDRHEVHHCGNDHSDLSYIINHCKCGKHNINRNKAKGHDFSGRLVEVEFFEGCPEGGWHIESGKIQDNNLNNKDE